MYVCMYLIACIFASPTKKNGFFFFSLEIHPLRYFHVLHGLVTSII